MAQSVLVAAQSLAAMSVCYPARRRDTWLVTRDT